MSLRKGGSLRVNSGGTGGTGPQGPAGPAGNTVLNGTTAPNSSIGKNGDFYINTATWFIYGPKAGNAWPAGVPLAGGGTVDPVASIEIGTGTGTADEGNSGTATFTFPVTRSVLLTGTSSVSWAVAAYGANPADPADFGGTFPTGTVTFNPGESSKSITVLATGDAIVEPTEGFVVTLSNPVGAVLGNVVTALGTITNDDSAPVGATTLDPALPVPYFAYTGDDANGKPEFELRAPLNMLPQGGDQVGVERDDTPEFIGSVYETQPLQPVDGANSAYALFNTTTDYFYRARFVRGTSHGPWSDLVTTDTVEPVINGTGTEALPTTTSAEEGAIFGPIVTANKPLKWTVGGPDAALFTLPDTYVQNLDLPDIVTDYETQVSIDISLTGVDLAGRLANTVWLRHTVLNNTADDPVRVGFIPGSGTGGADGSITLSNGDKTATMTRAEGERTILGEERGTGKRWIGYNNVNYPGGTVAFIGLMGANGVRVAWLANSETGTGQAWNFTVYPDDASHPMPVQEFLVTYDAVTPGNSTVQAFRNGVNAGTFTFTQLGITGPLKPYANLGYAVGPTASINTGQMPPTTNFAADVKAWGDA